MVYLVPCFHIFVLLLLILLFKTTIVCSAEVLSYVPKSKKTVMCLSEKIGMFR